MRLFTENIFSNVRLLLTRCGLPLGKEILKQLEQLQKFEIVACQNPKGDLTNEKEFEIIIHLVGFDPPSLAETLYHTSILHQLLDLALKHKSKFILITPEEQTSLKDVAISLVHQFSKLFKLQYHIIEIPKKMTTEEAATEVLKKFVHSSFFKKAKIIPEPVKEPLAEKAPNQRGKLIVGIIISIIALIFFVGYPVAKKSIDACAWNKLKVGDWMAAKRCAVIDTAYDLAILGEQVQTILTDPTVDDIKNLSIHLSTLGEKIASNQLELTPVLENYGINLSQLRAVILRSRQAVDDLPTLLGLIKPINYLVLIQDNHELRASGGFIEGLALISVVGGHISDVQLLSSFTADAQMKGSVEPPPDLKKSLGESNWYFRDSNWEADFPIVAQKAAWFVAKQLNRQIDVVVATNTSSLPSLLDIVGGVTLSDGKKITSANVAQNIIQKDVLLNIVQAILPKLQAMDPNQLGRVSAWTMENLLSRNLSLSGVTVNLNGIKAAGWDGGLSETASFYVVDSNVGVNKVDAWIERKLSYKATLDNARSQGEITLAYLNKSPSNDWPAGTYKNYIRVYLPKDVLVSAVSQEYQIVENGKWQIVGIMSQVLPQKPVVITIKYSNLLPATTSFVYRLDIPNQPGVVRKLDVSINYPKTWLSQTQIVPTVASTGFFGYNTTAAAPTKYAVEFLRR
ncbi:MAG: DUF4012 domain-containing protein [Patescibacteria group bacterium]